MKLIEADEAFRILSVYYHHRTETQADALREALELVPEAVVRCRDCIYYNRGELWGRSWNFCDYSENCYEESDYCSRGERRNDDADQQ